MYRLNVFILSEIIYNEGSACAKDWCREWIFDDEYNYGVDMYCERIKHMQWLEDMNDNCLEYLQYEEPSDFVPITDEDFDEIGF